MTKVWRRIQGVDTHGSVSDAEYLSMDVYLTLRFDLENDKKICSCRYTIQGDTIAWKHFESSDEALDWIHEKILDELEINIRAIQESKNET